MAHAHTSANTPKKQARSPQHSNKRPGTGRPSQAAHNKPKRNSLDRGRRIPTRELKLHIGILQAWLTNPVEAAKLSEADIKGMERRLAMYRDELALRDARQAAQENRPLSGDELAKSFAAHAQRGQRNGIRVQGPRSH